MPRDTPLKRQASKIHEPFSATSRLRRRNAKKPTRTNTNASFPAQFKPITEKSKELITSLTPCKNRLSASAYTDALPIFPHPSPNKRGVIAFPFPPVPLPLHVLLPPVLSNFQPSSIPSFSSGTKPSPEPSCFASPLRLSSPRLQLSFEVQPVKPSSSLDTLFGNPIESSGSESPQYTDIEHYHDCWLYYSPSRGRFKLVGENDKAFTLVGEERILSLRIMWPGYESSEMKCTFIIKTQTRRQVADLVTNRINAFMRDIKSMDELSNSHDILSKDSDGKIETVTSCTLPLLGGVKYSEYDIFHNKIKPQNVVLMGLVQEFDKHGKSFWYPQLKLVGIKYEFAQSSFLTTLGFGEWA